MSFRFLHIADVHLDTPFVCRDDEMRRMMKQEIRQAFARAVSSAIENKVDAILIAGDLFDNDTLTFASEKLIISEFQRLKEESIAVFYSPGNHDPAGAIYNTSRIKWPENVTVFSSREPRCVPVMEEDGSIKAYVVGAGFEKNAEKKNLAKKFPVAEGDAPYVGILHAEVSEAASGGESNYAPCSLKDITKLGYSYFALGHIHIRQELDKENGIIYSGNIMGRNPKETGIKGGYIAEVDNTSTSYNFIPLSDVVWSQVVMDDIKGGDSLEALKRMIVEKLEQEQDEGGLRRLIRVILSGRTKLYDELMRTENIEDLEEELRQEVSCEYIEIRIQKLIRYVDPESFKGQVNVLSDMLDMIEELRRDEDKLLSLMGDDIKAEGVSKDNERKEYLKELLESMEYEVTARMTTGGEGK